MIRNISTLLLVFGFSLIASFYYPHLLVAPGDVQKYHKKIENNCSNCHSPFSGVPNKKCSSCHEPEKMTKSKMIKFEKPVFINASVSDFHQQIGNSSCAGCHFEHLSSTINPHKRFKHDMETVKETCNQCHVKPDTKVHKGQIRCFNCHNTKNWKKVQFTHSTDQKNCEECHKKPDNSLHAYMKQNCETCHSTLRWKPANFDHSRHFVLSGEHNAPCKTCHTTNDFTKYTCFGCHEHTESNVAREHRRMNTNIENCVKCHKSGSERDAWINFRNSGGETTTGATPRGGRYDGDDGEHGEHGEHEGREHHEDDDD